MPYKLINYMLFYGFTLLLYHSPVIAQTHFSNSDNLLDVLNRMENLQREVRQLRGQMELQEHTLEGLKKRQRDLYLDLDQRIHQLETQRNSAAVVPTTATAPLAAPETPPLPIGEILDDPQAGRESIPRRLPNPITSAKISVGPVGSEKKAYNRAFSLLREGRYQSALTAFRDFQRQYPTGDYADNAQYWTGEASYVTRDFDLAMDAFQILIKNYPRSSKVPDALLKIAYIHYEQNQWNKSKKLLIKVQQEYPNSGASRLAQQRLKRMRLEGR